MHQPSLLVELFVEELPPKSLDKLQRSFADSIVGSLRAQGLVAPEAAYTPFGTPRRLGVRIVDVAARAADRQERQKLVPVKIGLDEHGQATPVLQKKLAALGLDASAAARCVRAIDGKNETLFVDVTVPGAALATALQTAFDEAIAKLPIPKVMTYQVGDGWSSVKFVRPAHRIVALHGDQVVPITGFGLCADRVTQGHRFESRAATLAIADADAYERQLADVGGVIASYAARRAEIARQLAAAAPAGLLPVDDPALLDEVTSLVENPNVLLCTFEAEFLAVPQECLILTMKQNQKYFPLLDAAGKLSNRFLVVSNIRPADASAIVGGNERVVRPRLADAKFFFDQDRKKSLESRIPGLAKVVYHNKLGTQGERVERVRAIARAVATALGGAATASAADRAALLAKADLLTDMVGEFPELQGIMGGYYARHDGESEAVAVAIEDHYKPRFAGDALPRNAVGLCVALADKLETLVGLFGIGQVPTGDKDPFALRRHALGVIRMLIDGRIDDNVKQGTGSIASGFPKSVTHGSIDDKLGDKGLQVDLGALLAAATAPFGASITDPSAALTSFLFDRLAVNLRDQGWTAAEVDAVLAAQPRILADVPKRLAAVRTFAALPEAAALAAANKRIGNILKKSDEALGKVQPSLLQEPAEKALHDALSAMRGAAVAKFASGDYQGALAACAALRGPVDAFFEAVMVNADDAALRKNRLALLAELHGLMNTIADLSRLAN
jgi:glycyl-tRNA synthetase beta chain